MCAHYISVIVFNMSKHGIDKLTNWHAHTQMFQPHKSPKNTAKNYGLSPLRHVPFHKKHLFISFPYFGGLTASLQVGMAIPNMDHSTNFPENHGSPVAGLSALGCDPCQASEPQSLISFGRLLAWTKASAQWYHILYSFMKRLKFSRFQIFLIHGQTADQDQLGDISM